MTIKRTVLGLEPVRGMGDLPGFSAKTMAVEQGIGFLPGPFHPRPERIRPGLPEPDPGFRGTGRRRAAAGLASPVGRGRAADVREPDGSHRPGASGTCGDHLSSVTQRWTGRAESLATGLTALEGVLAIHQPGASGTCRDPLRSVLESVGKRLGHATGPPGPIPGGQGPPCGCWQRDPQCCVSLLAGMTSTAAHCANQTEPQG